MELRQSGAQGVASANRRVVISELGWAFFREGVALGSLIPPLFRFAPPLSTRQGAASVPAEPPEFVVMVTGSLEAFLG